MFVDDKRGGTAPTPTPTAQEDLFGHRDDEDADAYAAAARRRPVRTRARRFGRRPRAGLRGSFWFQRRRTARVALVPRRRGERNARAIRRYGNGGGAKARRPRTRDTSASDLVDLNLSLRADRGKHRTPPPDRRAPQLGGARSPTASSARGSDRQHQRPPERLGKSSATTRQGSTEEQRSDEGRASPARLDARPPSRDAWGARPAAPPQQAFRPVAADDDAPPSRASPPKLNQSRSARALLWSSVEAVGDREPVDAAARHVEGSPNVVASSPSREEEFSPAARRWTAASTTRRT